MQEIAAVPQSVSHAAERLVDVTDFLQAVKEQAWEQADSLWPAVSAVDNDRVRLAAAELHQQRERWDEAAEAWSRLRLIDDQARLKLTLCRNLAALKTHRPQVYRAVVDADVGDAYRIHPTESGKSTIAAQRASDRYTLFSNDPLGNVQTILRQLKPAIDRGDALALLSIGDGHVLKAIVDAQAALFLGREQAIFLIEPDPRLALATLLIHDFTGPRGPIEQQRVLWYVGPKWAEAFRVDSINERFFPIPQINIKLGLDPQSIEKVIADTIAELGRLDAQAQQAVAKHYDTLPADHYAKAMAGTLGRSPRVLLVTTRFSTVLQYSTRDTAGAFRQIGWEAQVVIEPTPYHGLTRLGLRRMLADFKPDLIFQIDHNRFEHGDLFPASIPFVNWIQDLLPHLMKHSTGQTLTPRDFVLTPSLQKWVDEYSYPAAQCLEFRKLTRVPVRPISWTSRDERVVYVSNWSQSPNEIRDELTRSSTGKTRDVIDAACAKMIATYETGQTIHTPGDCRRLLVEVTGQMEVTADAALLSETATRLSDRMNNLLYRQQGLAWAQQACHELGLTLEIYGNGWDKHPKFGRNARGTIGYGDDLESLTREAGVSLVLEPFVCITHQRLLDAMVAGGFCLMRSHPSNGHLHELIHWISRARDPRNTADLEAQLGQDDLAGWRATLAKLVEVESDPGRTDFIAVVRRLQREGFMPNEGVLLPLLDQVTFNDAAGLKAALQRFVINPELRSEIARFQRQTIESRFSYTAGMRRVIAFLHERLVDESRRTPTMNKAA